MKISAALPTKNEWIFSLKTFAASMIALYIALAAGLPRPYWAMACVYIVANPLTGLTRSKAVYRAAGTVAGASVAVFITPLLINSPILLTLVICLWTGLLTFLALFDRSPRAYGFMLSGYTVPLIVFPSFYAPTTIFDTATARAEEILLGIVCAAVINSVVFPASLTGTVSKTTEGLLADVRGWLRSFSDKDRDGEAMKQSQRLAADAVALDNLIVHLRYDVAASNMARHLKTFKERIARMPIILHGLGDRLSVLRSSRLANADLADLLSELDVWIGSEAQSEEQLRASAARIREKHDRLVEATRKNRDWDSLILMNALSDIGDLIDIWRDCGILQAEIKAGNLARRKVDLVSTQAVESHLQYDVAAQALTGASVALSGFIGCLIWLYSDWQAGLAFAMMALIAGPFFGAMDNPLPPMKAMAVFTVASNVMAFIFIFGALPNVNSYWGLVGTFAVPFILFGTIMSRPQFALPGMLMTVGTASTVALTSTYSTNFVNVVDGAIASVLGVLFATLWSALTHALGASVKANRTARMGWRDLAALARGRVEFSPAQYAGRGLDRLAQFFPRQAATAGTPLEDLDMMAELRIGKGLAHLRAETRRLPKDKACALDSIFLGVAGWFEAKLRTANANEPDPAILSDIDRAFVTFGSEPGCEPLLSALADLRRSLFPLAAAPRFDPDPRMTQTGPSALAAA